MKISEAEGKVMDVFWRAQGPLSADDVVEAMENDRDWTPGTIRTFLTRLVKKKALAAAPDGRRYLYSPLIPREDYVHEQSRRLIDTLVRRAHCAVRYALLGPPRSDAATRSTELKRLIEKFEHER